MSAVWSTAALLLVACLLCDGESAVHFRNYRVYVRTCTSRGLACAVEAVEAVHAVIVMHSQ